MSRDNTNILSILKIWCILAIPDFWHSCLEMGGGNLHLVISYCVSRVTYMKIMESWVRNSERATYSGGQLWWSTFLSTRGSINSLHFNSGNIIFWKKLVGRKQHSHQAVKEHGSPLCTMEVGKQRNSAASKAQGSWGCVVDIWPKRWHRAALQPASFLLTARCALVYLTQCGCLFLTPPTTAWVSGDPQPYPPHEEIKYRKRAKDSSEIWIT